MDNELHSITSNSSGVSGARRAFLKSTPPVTIFHTRTDKAIMSLTRRSATKATLFFMSNVITAATLTVGSANTAYAAAADFGPSNPFYAPSTLPFQAPPFDKIKDEDYRPAIEAGMARQLAEIQAIANDREPPTFANTFVPLERSGRLLDRSLQAFNGVTEANTNPTLQAAKSALAPEL